MSNLALNIDSIPDNVDFELIPSGKYMMEIVGSEVKSNKTDTGLILKLKLKILDEDYFNRIIWMQVNATHSTSEKAQQIGQSIIKSICKAIGFEGTLTDSSSLHGIPLIGHVVITPENNGYPERNDIKRFEPYIHPIAVEPRANLTSQKAPAFLKKSPPPQKVIDDEIPF